jgi:hypothetical protein
VARSSSAVSARRVAGVLGGLGLGVIGGFVASLFRRRPPTIYAEGLPAGLPESGPDAGNASDSVREVL